MRGGIYKGPGGQPLHGDGTPVMTTKPMTTELTKPNLGQSRAYGMNVRTWLAGMAMQGILAADEQDARTERGLVLCAISMADALLKELEK